MNHNWVMALLGGVLIGISVSIMLLFNGRVTGISGIVGGLLSPRRGDSAWRIWFLGGLLVGGIFLQVSEPSVFRFFLPTDLWVVVLAGLLVGFGTSMGGGCTSGHGVCGISRLSKRSIVATLCFIGAGVVTLALMRLTGLLP